MWYDLKILKLDLHLFNFTYKDKDVAMALEKITIGVDGMSCGHCSGMVKKTLEEMPGISNVSVDLEGKKAVFDADNPDLIDKAVEAVTEAGYTASKI